MYLEHIDVSSPPPPPDTPHDSGDGDVEIVDHEEPCIATPGPSALEDNDDAERTMTDDGVLEDAEDHDDVSGWQHGVLSDDYPAWNPLLCDSEEFVNNMCKCTM